MNRRRRHHPSRFDNLSDAEIQARWRALRPMSLKWLIICSVAAPALFLAYRLWQPGPQMTFLFSLAFRIAVGGVGMFAFLTCLALYFSRPQQRS
jgi:hypothetical protein